MKKIAIAAILASTLAAAPAMADNSIAVFTDYQSTSLSNAGLMSNPSLLRMGATINTGQAYGHEVSYSTTISDSAYSDSTGAINVTASILAYNVVANFPIQSVEGLKVGVRVGVNYMTGKASATGVYAASTDGTSASTSNFAYGLSASYDVNKQIAVRASWEQLGKLKLVDTAPGADVSALSVGASYAF